MGGSADQFVVVPMCSDPEPHELIGQLHGKRAVVGTDSRRAEASDLLEVQARVAGIPLETRKRLVGESLDVFWQGTVASPEVRGGMVRQTDLVRPAP